MAHTPAKKLVAKGLMGRRQRTRKCAPSNTPLSVEQDRSPYFTNPLGNDPKSVTNSHRSARLRPKSTEVKSENVQDENIKPKDFTNELIHVEAIANTRKAPNDSNESSGTKPRTLQLGKNSTRPKRKVMVAPKASEQCDEDSLSEYVSTESEDWKPRAAYSESTSSSQEFVPFKSTTKIRQKKPGKKRLSTQKTRRQSTSKKDPVPATELSDDSDEEDEDCWLNVEEKSFEEADLINSLLAAKHPNTTEDNTNKGVINIALSSSSKKVSTKDPKLLAEQARLRARKEKFASMHFVHVMCFLAHARSLNLICDSPLYRALGLSLSVLPKRDISSWTLNDLKKFAESFHVNIKQPTKMDFSSPLLLMRRVSEGCLSRSDCVILLVAALRAVGFDVRLVVGLTPISLDPNNSNLPPDVSVVPLKKRQNLSIVSSSSDELLQNKTTKNSKNSAPKIVSFAEVYLRTLNRWVSVLFVADKVVVDEEPTFSSLYYVIGMTSSFACSVDTVPYVGRNPVDLAPRYDPGWCVYSRVHRMSAEKWKTLLNYQRHLFDLDAALSYNICPPKPDLPVFQRDRDDEDRIRSMLLAKPLPTRLADFKNHPLYALQRHLLKFEVIYPPEAVSLGFFRGEPVYSRDCVHLCHTRESWLKEAKTVKLHEKPAKVVKARMSLKRQLLQGSDPNPQTVDVFGPWQVEDYQPPVAENGIVPRNAHGTIDLFKPSMLPIGCVHICLSGIHLIAKKLGIDCAPAITGFAFHRAGWAIPQIHGYVVCKEAVPALIDAWRTSRMNAAKAAAEERSNRAVDNWRRLVRGLFLWHKVRAKFALSALHDEPRVTKSKKVVKPKVVRHPDVGEKPVAALKSVELGTVTSGALADGWHRLGQSESVPSFPAFKSEEPVKKRKNSQRRSSTVVRKRSRQVSSSEDDTSDQSDSADFVAPSRTLRSRVCKAVLG